MRAYRAGREEPLPSLSIQYADYAVWQREQLQGTVLGNIDVLKERLAGAPKWWICRRINCDPGKDLSRWKGVL